MPLGGGIRRPISWLLGRICGCGALCLGRRGPWWPSWRVYGVVWGTDYATRDSHSRPAVDCLFLIGRAETKSMTRIPPKPVGTPAKPAEPVLLTEAEVDQVAGGTLLDRILDAYEKARPAPTVVHLHWVFR